MSARILRHARVTQALCSANVVAPARRCYSALAIAQHLPHVDQDTRPYDTLVDTRDAPFASSSSSTLQAEVRVEQVAEQPPPPKKKHAKKKKQPVKHAEQIPDFPEVPSRDPLSPSKAELHLAAIQAAGLEPTLNDLNRLQPKHHPPITSPRFALKYNELVDTICRTFSREQLRRLITLADLDPLWSRLSRKKVEYAETIIEEIWGWPKLAEVERALRDRTEVSQETIPVTASQLFLILGRDGIDLLELSKQCNVHIALLTHPLSLRVEGLRGALKRLRDRVTDIKESIVEVTFQLPSRQAIRPDMIQRISRLGGAYIENLDTEGKIKICAKDFRTLSIAKRLASRAAYELNESARTPILAYAPASKSSESVPALLFPRTYSMYPFLSPRLLPWTMNTSGAFRVRRVGEWLKQGAVEHIHITGGLAGGMGRILTPTQQSVDLDRVLLDALPEQVEPQVERNRSYKASIGHMLFTTRSTGQRATILPPLEGQHDITRVLKWIAEGHVQSSFLPSLPPSLMGSAPQRQKIIHRLVYHVLRKPGSNPAETSERSSVYAQSTKVLSFEVVLPQTYYDSDSATSNDHPDVILADAQCWVGIEAKVDIMMPDRPMDMRLTALDKSNIDANQQPQELQAYISGLREFLVDPQPTATQPDPPLTLMFENESFILHTSATVRHSEELVTCTPGPAFGAVTESVLDLESNYKSTHCEIFCEDHASPNAWRNFLGHCDFLTTSTFVPVGVRRVEESINDVY
ncbi:hypothetical protein OBBRIDRAFT_883448 [Obba rivulosa]|uniref:Uncharacterized protein n=1 Tax=Obba rivulosa TaxID=1052685 RepID=A0A8E2J859_9APHY|nr:hypothetical protein OBBRIDRAFT_883448 [Obba rivulosa]